MPNVPLQSLQAARHQDVELWLQAQWKAKGEKRTWLK